MKAIVCNCSIVPAEQLRSSRCKGTCPEMLMGQPLIRSLLWKHLLCLRQLSWLASACFCNWRKHSAVIVKALSFYHPWASINFCSTSQFEKVWYAWTSWTYARHPANICKYMVLGSCEVVKTVFSKILQYGFDPFQSCNSRSWSSGSQRVWPRHVPWRCEQTLSTFFYEVRDQVHSGSVSVPFLIFLCQV